MEELKRSVASYESQQRAAAVKAAKGAQAHAREVESSVLPAHSSDFTLTFNFPLGSRDESHPQNGSETRSSRDSRGPRMRSALPPPTTA